MRSLKLTIIFIIFFQLNAFAGPITSGGGDGYAAEFTKFAYAIVGILKNSPSTFISPSLLKNAIENTRVITKERLIWQNEEVGAINYPSTNKIELSREHWRILQGDNLKKLVLVFHEYLGILKIDDSRYQISNKLFENLGAYVSERRCRIFENFGEYPMIGDKLSYELIIYQSIVENHYETFAVMYKNGEIMTNTSVETLEGAPEIDSSLSITPQEIFSINMKITNDFHGGYFFFAQVPYSDDVDFFTGKSQWLYNGYLNNKYNMPCRWITKP